MLFAWSPFVLGGTGTAVSVMAYRREYEALRAVFAGVLNVLPASFYPLVYGLAHWYARAA